MAREYKLGPFTKDRLYYSKIKSPLVRASMRNRRPEYLKTLMTKKKVK